MSETSDLNSETLTAYLTEAQNFRELGDLKAAIASYQKALSLDPNSPQAHWQLGDVLNQINFPAEALQHKQQALTIQPNLLSAEVHNQLGLNSASQGNLPEAVVWFQRAIVVKPDSTEAHYNLGVAWAEQGNLEAAIASFEAVINLNSHYINAQLNLANLHSQLGQTQAANDWYKKSQELGIYATKQYNLAVELIEAEKFEAAIACLQTVIAIGTDEAKAYSQMGIAFRQKGDFEKAISYLNQALKLNPNLAEAWCYLGAVMMQIGKLEEAIQYLHKSLKIDATLAETYYQMGNVYRTQGQITEAIAWYEKANSIAPESLKADRMAELALPILYTDIAEISQWRQRFQHGLDKFSYRIANLDLSLEANRREALASINCSTNFYLGYQEQNDLDLQIQYGNLVHQIMAAAYPQWVEPLTMPPLSPTGKIRIGYVSAQLRAHSGTKWAIGWLKYRDRDQFEVFSYLADLPSDAITQEFAQASDFFHHIPNDITALCQQILGDRLHVLIYPDIGMHPLNTQLAALRLAPVQCVGWGHPVTTGLPTMDYFLSSQVMEPEAAQAHYSEQLVLLPKLGVSYPLPKFNKLNAEQKIQAKLKFGFRAEATIFLSCQALYKYLPQYDFVFAAIAQQLPQCQFAFLSHPTSSKINQIFWERLRRVFAEYSLDAEDYCVILPRGNKVDYLISDISLDTFAWSGGNMSLEAIACDLPIVTMPGEFMRGRHTYAMLQVLGVTDTMAQNTDEYIDIAVRLAIDKPWRDSITTKMHQNHHLLFDDLVCVRALEDFFKQVVLPVPN